MLYLQRQKKNVPDSFSLSLFLIKVGKAFHPLLKIHNYIGFMLIIQDMLIFSLVTLIIPAKFLLPCKVTCIGLGENNFMSHYPVYHINSIVKAQPFSAHQDIKKNTYPGSFSQIFQVCFTLNYFSY